MGDRVGRGLEEAVCDDIQRVLSRYPVSLALLFGSAARGSGTGASDIDIAIEFDSLRPDDDGYSEMYLGVLSDLDDATAREVDVVDVHTLSPQFAHVVFDEGILLRGSLARRRELENEIAGDPPSVREARERVSAAVERLREEP